jgi:3-dehydroquinate synthase
VVPGGEAAKRSWETVRDILTTIGNLHLDRQSCVVAAGGGSVLDMVGFAASIVHRGLRLVRLPSTTLSQCDAGIGVKNGMNEHGQKNFIGSFAPPFAVLSDLDFLASLPFEAWIAGIAEAFKVAIIKDAAFLEELVRSAPALRARDERALEPALRRAAALHLEHIRTSGDPFEFGSARPLDFGHWAAHKLEVLSGYSLGHGQAVAVGIALDSAYARRIGLLAERELETILRSLDACGLPTYVDLLDRRDRAGTLIILEGLEEFREHLGGRLTVTLPQGLGRKVDVHQMEPGLVSACVEELRARAPGR